MADENELLQKWTGTPALLSGWFGALTRWLKHNRIILWILYWGRRSVVSVALILVVFSLFLVLAWLRPVDMAQIVSETSTLRTLFTALLSGAILIVSVVTSISSIVLSKEISDIETEQERVAASIEFQQRAEKLADVEGSPGQPAAFLEVILYTLYRETKVLQRVASDSDNEEFRDEIAELSDVILSETQEAGETLDGAKFGTFKVLSAGLNYDYSWQLNTARRIQNRHAATLSETETDALSNLVDTLKLFATGREYFESLYYKREVARLSSALLYVSLPVIVFISYLMLALDANMIPRYQLGPFSSLPAFILFAYTVSLAPYIILTSHVIRIASLTLQTLAAGPFQVRPSDRKDIVELELDTNPSEWHDQVAAEMEGEGQSDEASAKESADSGPFESDDGSAESADS